jgi:hypothetical protein
MKLHHATIKKAARLAVEIIEIPGELPTFRAIRLSDHAESAIFDSAPALLDAVEKDEAKFTAAPSFKRNRSGVMVMSYHIRYTANGGGCGDDLDQALRDLLVNEEGTNLELLRAVADNHDVWVAKWNGLNPGMQRMNLANRLRARLRNEAEFEVNLQDEGKGRFGVVYQPSGKTQRRARKAASIAQNAE